MNAHRSIVTGPGCPKVLIGGFPAASLGDMHVCSKFNLAPLPVPHVGDSITGPGEPKVLICGRPAANFNSYKKRDI